MNDEASLYCSTCDLIYDEPVAACPHCDGGVVPWDDRYLRHDPRKGSLMHGAIVLLCLHVLQVFALLMPEDGLIYWFGITQVFYAVPAIVVLAVKGKSASVGGIVIAAGLTFFANLVVFGMMCASMLDGSYY